MGVEVVSIEPTYNNVLGLMLTLSAGNLTKEDKYFARAQLRKIAAYIVELEEPATDKAVIELLKRYWT